MNKDTHFLVWWRFRMACGKSPCQVWTSASFWHLVTCTDCLKARTGEMTEP